MTPRLLPNGTTLIVFALLLALPFVILWPMWWHPEAMAYDMADYFLPYRYFIGECLQQHCFPWWNPYSGLGVPMAADPQSGALYPVTWFTGYFFGYDFFTINVEFLLHLAIAGFGMFTLLRGLKFSIFISLLLACSYQFCGFFINNAQHYSWIISAAWLPFIVHYYRKIFLSGTLKDAIALALSMSLFTTGGYPAFLIILMYLLGGHFLLQAALNLYEKKWTLVLRRLQWSAVSLFAYLLLLLPYAYAFFEGIPLMTRGEGLANDPALLRIFSPQSAITFLLPAVPLGQNRIFDTDTSMTNVYIGLLALVFLLVAVIRNRKMEVRMLLALSLLFLLIAFGNALPFWSLIFNYLPFIDHIRFPAAFRLFIIIGCIMVAAEGLQLEMTNKTRLPVVIATVLIGLLITGVIIVFASGSHYLLPQSFSTKAMLEFFGKSNVPNNILLQSAIQIIFLLWLLLLLYAGNKWKRNRWLAMILLFVATDFFVASRINFTTIISSPFSSMELNKKLQNEPHGFPIWNAKDEKEVTNVGNGSFAPSYFNNNLFTKHFSADSYSPFVLKATATLQKSQAYHALVDRPVLYVSNKVQPLLQHNAESLRIADDAVLLPEAVATQFAMDTDTLTSDLQLTGFNNHSFEADVKVSQPALLVLQQNYYPGWKVKVDGVSSIPVVVNYCMMSVLLPEGNHHVEFYYDTALLNALFIFSAILYLFGVLSFLLSSFNSSRSNALNSRRE